MCLNNLLLNRFKAQMMSESFNMLKQEFEELLHGVPKLPMDVRQDLSNGKRLDYSRILATVADDIDTYERTLDWFGMILEGPDCRDRLYVNCLLKSYEGYEEQRKYILAGSPEGFAGFVRLYQEE